MIDLQTESIVSLTEATKYIPRRRAGRKCHVSTLHRWAKDGCRGIRLEAIRVGGTLCTSLEALQRFCDRLTGNEPTITIRDSRKRQQQISEAKARVAAAGL